MMDLLRRRISPNQFYLMLSFKESTVPVGINTQMELRILKTDGWITEDNRLTQQAMELVEEIESTYSIKTKTIRKKILGPDALEYITQYRELFPKGILPSGSPSRVNIKELEKKFTWFFNNYEFSWEVILAATKAYIEKYEANGYKFMQNSTFFISKQDNSKIITSALANHCDQLLEGDDISSKSDQQAVII